MGVFHGKLGEASFNGIAVGEIKSWSYEETVELADKTVMGDAAKAYSPGIPDGSGTCTCVMSVVTGTGADAGQADVDIGDEVQVILYPSGDNAGYSKWSGTAIVTSISRGGDLGSMGEFSFGFTGALTQGTV